MDNDTQECEGCYKLLTGAERERAVTRFATTSNADCGGVWCDDCHAERLCERCGESYMDSADGLCEGCRDGGWGAGDNGDPYSSHCAHCGDEKDPPMVPGGAYSWCPSGCDIPASDRAEMDADLYSNERPSVYGYGEPGPVSDDRWFDTPAEWYGPE